MSRQLLSAQQRSPASQSPMTKASHLLSSLGPCLLSRSKCCSLRSAMVSALACVIALAKRPRQLFLARSLDEHIFDTLRQPSRESCATKGSAGDSVATSSDSTTSFRLGSPLASCLCRSRRSPTASASCSAHRGSFLMMLPSCALRQPGTSSPSSR